jgi:ribosomal protein S18 acetylase RimI-like enzyme
MMRAGAGEAGAGGSGVSGSGGSGAGGFEIVRGLPAGREGEAAALYWQAFGGKLGRVMGPEARARAFLTRAIRPDHCLAALAPDGRLLGCAGFKTAAGSFAGGSVADLQAVYGRVGTLWRMVLLRLLERDVERERFLMDGLCVADGARGQGVGQALVRAICVEAAARGYREVRLDVVDTNARARALYERLGFRAVATDRLGALRLVFGFASATTMVRPAGA